MNLLDLLISPAFAQAAAPASAPSPWSLPIMLGGFFLLMYFMVLRPQSKRAKEHRTMLEKLAKGDEVITSGGIAGVVREIGDSFVTVEVSDNVTLRVQRGAIGHVLPKGTLKSQ
jgi:preprotein translocase subunit YajC